MPIRFILLLVSITICFSCGHDRNKEIAKEKAQKFIASLTSTRLKDLSHWNYVERGDLRFWYLDSAGTQNCFTTIEERNDSSILKVGKAKSFLKIFQPSLPAHLPVHPNADSIILIKDHEWHLISKYTNGEWYITDIGDADYKLFKDQNPLYLFKDMNWFNRSFGIKGIWSDNSIGNFVQFFFNEGYILTYFPDSLSINPRVEEYWEKDFESGETLSKNWNLRKWQQSK